ncbi:MAG TPA: sialidase family protein [Anaeromyxobacteraceae bacterium]|nr:sialidase family protein [Anaeromyxobacteraceae bacterium]
MSTHVRRSPARILTIALTLLAPAGAFAATTAGRLGFTNTPLTRPEGDSEPAVAIGRDGTMAVTGLNWLTFGTNLWTGTFGSTPTFRGIVDGALQKPGKRIFGGGDADVDLGATGTLHASTLIFLANPTLKAFQLGVSAIACRDAGSPGFAISTCTEQVIDGAGADRQWITSDGATVYISYHDAGNSSLVHVQRSDDDGFTWFRVGDPIPAQGAATGAATFNNDQGNLVADPVTHNVYAIYAAGEPGIQKGTSAAFNNVFVSRSSDGGKTWKATLVFHAPLFTALNNVFPALAVDPTSGALHATWSDGVTVSYATSSDAGVTWSTAVAVNAAPASTAVFPAIAARAGVVDLAYYGTTAASKDDPAAVWNVYLAQTANGGRSFTQSTVSTAPNHVGPICTEGTACAAGTRNLLDLFEVAIDPATGRAAIVYADDLLTTDSTGAPLPQLVLATQR